MTQAPDMTFNDCNLEIIRNNNLTEMEIVLKEFRQDDHWFDVATEMCLVVFYTIVIFLGVIGNSIVCYIVFRYRYLQNPRNYFIVNLSVCDIVMCVFCMPFSLMKLTLKNWHLGEFLCRVVPSLQNIDVFVSTFTIVAIAIDRYRAIVCVSRDEVHRHVVGYMITAIWITSILFCTPMLIFHKVEVPCFHDYGIMYKLCLEKWPSEASKGIYTTFVMLVQYFGPITIIISLHVKICHVLRTRIQRDPVTEAELQRAIKDIKRHRKNMMLLTAIAISFALTWLPWTVLNMTADFDYHYFLDKNFNLMYAICLLVAMSSASINPIMYGWFNTNFREAFMSSFFFWKRELSESQELITIRTDSRDKKGYGSNKSPSPSSQS